MSAKDLRNAIARMYARLNYYEFCEYMNFNPKYDEKYWDAFRKLSDAISEFDDENLQKILDFCKERTHAK